MTTIRRAHVWTVAGLEYLTIEDDWPDEIYRGGRVYEIERRPDGKPITRRGPRSGIEVSNYYVAHRRYGPIAPPPADPAAPPEGTPDESERASPRARGFGAWQPESVSAIAKRSGLDAARGGRARSEVPTR